jgi:hypothetical protein
MTYMKKSLLEMVPDIRGCYLLTAGGRLGSYGEDNLFHQDDKLSLALSELVQAFSSDYQRTRHTNGWRIGIVHTDHANQPWHSATLALEDYVLRDLYPMPSAGQNNLTAFQRGNREKSLFRGVELLLNHHDPMAPNTPSFCPVLVYRSTTLAQYNSGSGREPRPSDAQTPVVEMINLLAGATLTQSCNPAVEQLVRAVRRNLVKPELRSIPNLHILDQARDGMPARSEPVARHSGMAAQPRRTA